MDIIEERAKDIFNAIDDIVQCEYREEKQIKGIISKALREQDAETSKQYVDAIRRIHDLTIMQDKLEFRQIHEICHEQIMVD